MNLKKKGFTLMELMLSIALISVIGVLGARITQASLEAYAFSRRMVSQTLETQLALERLTAELRTAKTSEITLASENPADISFVTHFISGDENVRYFLKTDEVTSENLFRIVREGTSTDTLLEKVRQFEITRTVYDYYQIRIVTREGINDTDLMTGVTPGH